MTTTIYTLANLEAYTTEVHRAHLVNAGYRAFKHPNSASAVIMVHNGVAVGMLPLSTIEHDTARFQNAIMFKQFLPLDD